MGLFTKYATLVDRASEVLTGVLPEQMRIQNIKGSDVGVSRNTVVRGKGWSNKGTVWQLPRLHDE